MVLHFVQYGHVDAAHIIFWSQSCSTFSVCYRKWPNHKPMSTSIWARYLSLFFSSFFVHVELPDVSKINDLSSPGKKWISRTTVATLSSMLWALAAKKWSKSPATHMHPRCLVTDDLTFFVQLHLREEQRLRHVPHLPFRAGIQGD